MSEGEALSGSDSVPEIDDRSITLTIAYDRSFWRTAMTGWWRSVVPPDPLIQRAIFWAVVWFAIGILTLGLSALDIGPSYVFAGLIGAAFLISVFGYLQRTRMSRFWDIVGAPFSPEELTHSDFRTQLNRWRAS